MSSPGYFYTPEDQEQITALQRRQAYAKALLQQGSGDAGSAAYGGLRNAGNSILGAILANKADKQEQTLTQGASQKYAQDLGKFLSGSAAGQQPMQPQTVAPNVPNVPSPQITNAAGPSQPMSTPQMAPQDPQQPPGGGPAPMPASAAPPQQQAQPQGSYNPMQALIATGNPALMQQFGPTLFQHQLDVNDKKIIPLSDQEANSLGLRPGGVYGREAATGNLAVIQPSDMKSQGAIQQGYDVAKNTPMTAEQQASYRLQAGTAAETARHNRVEETISQNPFGTGMGGAAGGANLTGDDFLQRLPPGLASQIKAVGTYRQPAPAGRTNPTGIKFMTFVNQAYPSYDATQYGAKTKARNDFTTGKNGNTVRSLNVAVQHLDQLGQLSDALGNGNMQVANQIGNAFNTQFGASPATNFNAAKQIVGDEIVKAIVGAGGGVGDRDKAAASISAASSPQQLKGVIQTYQGLMSGQLSGLKQQYQKSTGLDDFEDYLAPETKAKLQVHAAAPQGSNAAPKVIRYEDMK